MNRNQQAYDRGTSLYSPDGRIYQVEYAREAVKRGAPSVGVRASDGVVLAARSRASSELMESESIEKLHKIDDHVGAASAGHVADARKLIDYARRQAQVEHLRYGEPIATETLAKRVTDFVQESTQLGGTRPYGASLLLAGVDGDEPRLFETDPSGTPHEWRAVAIGGDQSDVLDFFEEEYDPEIDVEAAVDLALRGLYGIADGEFDPETVSVATVTPDAGYERVDTEVVADHLDRLRDRDEDEDADAGVDADE